MSTPAKKLIFILGVAIFATTILSEDLFRQEPKINPLWGKVDQLSSEDQITSSEDFAFFQEKVPGLFFFLNVKPEGGKPIPTHSPNFFVDEKALIVGIRTMSHLAIDFLAGK